MTNFEGRSYIDSIPKSLKAKRFFWELCYFLFFKPTPRVGFNKWRIFLLRLFGSNIQRGCRVLPTAKIWAPWNLTMGEYSVIGDAVDCYCMDKVIIGDRVTVSQRAFLCAGSHDINSLRLPLITAPINIEDFAWVCAEVYVAPGVTVQEGTVVGAGSVLVKTTEPWSVYVGNAAKKIKNREIITLDEKNEQFN
jgi:putative colanic acid biosynthesis acetyltransferase WcaF